MLLWCTCYHGSCSTDTERPKECDVSSNMDVKLISIGNIRRNTRDFVPVQMAAVIVTNGFLIAGQSIKYTCICVGALQWWRTNRKRFCTKTFCRVSAPESCDPDTFGRGPISYLLSVFSSAHYSNEIEPTIYPLCIRYTRSQGRPRGELNIKYFWPKYNV